MTGPWLGDDLRVRQPAHEALADALRRRIALGGYPVGAKLPSERELVQGLGVGRTTVRQAKRLLEAEGLIVTSRGRSGGSIVQNPAETTASGTATGHDWRSMIEDAYRLRLALEPLAAGWAAERATPSEKQHLRTLTTQTPEDLARYHSLDSELHVQIARMSQSQVLADAIAQAREEMFRHTNLLWLTFGDSDADEGSPSEYFQGFGNDHEPVVAAIASGSFDRAQRAMVEHLSASRDQFVGQLTQVRSGDRQGHEGT